jgi:two-component system chemotaxis response regulator CheB
MPEPERLIGGQLRTAISNPSSPAWRPRSAAEAVAPAEAAGSASARDLVVVLVSSVGGLDALTRVLVRLPAGFPAAIVALQHHDPDRASGLAVLLDRAGPLPVADACDGEALRPARVFATPSGHHTLIAPDRTLALIRSGPRPPHRPSADLLLTSLAISMGPGAIAVVLTGFGRDGAAGVTAVKRFGGTVLVSDHASSREFSMPEAAIGTGHVDQVLPLDEIGDALVQLVGHPGCAAPPVAGLRLGDGSAPK